MPMDLLFYVYILGVASQENFAVGSMVLAVEQISKDGTLKRSYELSDGQLIEVG